MSGDPIVDELDELRERLALSARRHDEDSAAIAARDQFLSMVSHELRTPVQALLFHLDATLKISARDEQTEEWFRGRVVRALARVQDLAGLLDKFLDVSRIQAGRIDLRLEETDLVDTARDAIGRMSDELTWAGCATQLVGPERVMGRWDRTRLRAVITNLLSNARKYGAGQPILVRVDADGERARLAVEDGGKGIAPEHQARIFERFERIFEGSGPHVTGVGLGLWITRHFVEAHGGNIEVANRPEGGAVFSVTLPR